MQQAAKPAKSQLRGPASSYEAVQAPAPLPRVRDKGEHLEQPWNPVRHFIGAGHSGIADMRN
jgi:hypothetical protein